MSSKVSSEAGEAGTAELERELDRLSLEQALRDFDVANARAIDLTQRLVDLTKEVGNLREQLVGAHAEVERARRENEAIRASVTFRVQGWADRLRRLRRR
jgi:predicted  nucleic acid-binding Zn-ribbon protein